MEECGYCSKREKETRRYLDEIEKEKTRECEKALERQKIANGIRGTRADELSLRAAQLSQAEARRLKALHERDIDMAWHAAMMDDVTEWEQQERENYARRQMEMQDRRRTYDEQIASANRVRQESLRFEREKENAMLERMKKKMEHDYYDGIKRKREQQMTNRHNFIEGHELKLARIYNEKARERQQDVAAINAALEETRLENQRKANLMHNLQVEKQIFVDNYNRERRFATRMEEEANRITATLKLQEEKKSDEYAIAVEEEKRIEKEKAAEEYQQHIGQRNRERVMEKEDRAKRMARVSREAVVELGRKLDQAKDELTQQLNYRNSLDRQIMDNQKLMDMEARDVESRLQPFTRKAELFKDAMDKVAKTPSRASTNPVHPFKRIIVRRKEVEDSIQLPLIGKSVHRISNKR